MFDPVTITLNSDLKEANMKITGSLDFEAVLAYNKKAEYAWDKSVEIEKVFNPRYLTDKTMPKEGNITDYLSDKLAVSITDREGAFLALFALAYGLNNSEEAMIMLMKIGLVHLNKEHSNG